MLSHRQSLYVYIQLHSTIGITIWKTSTDNVHCNTDTNTKSVNTHPVNSRTQLRATGSRIVAENTKNCTKGHQISPQRPLNFHLQLSDVIVTFIVSFKDLFSLLQEKVRVLPRPVTHRKRCCCC